MRGGAIDTPPLPLRPYSSIPPPPFLAPMVVPVLALRGGPMPVASFPRVLHRTPTRLCTGTHTSQQDGGSSHSVVHVMAGGCRRVGGAGMYYTG